MEPLTPFFRQTRWSRTKGGVEHWTHEIEWWQTIPSFGPKVAPVFIAETGGDKGQVHSAVALFFVLGLAVLVGYALTGTWMAVVGRRDPGPTFQIGRFGWIERRHVTAAEWIGRYLRWGLAGGLLLTVLGLIVTRR